MSRKSRKQRNLEQLVRQQRVRDEARVKRRPSRDDVARMLLWLTIHGVQTIRRDVRAVLDRLRDEVVEGLERQRFSVRESEEVFEELVAKYASGLFPFRPKRCLRRAEGWRRQALACQATGTVVPGTVSAARSTRAHVPEQFKCVFPPLLLITSFAPESSSREARALTTPSPRRCKFCPSHLMVSPSTTERAAQTMSAETITVPIHSRDIGLPQPLSLQSDWGKGL